MSECHMQSIRHRSVNVKNAESGTFRLLSLTHWEFRENPGISLCSLKGCPGDDWKKFHENLILGKMRSPIQ